MSPYALVLFILAGGLASLAGCSRPAEEVELPATPSRPAAASATSPTLPTTDAAPPPASHAVGDARFTLIEVNAAWPAVAAADFDGDGRLDLVGGRAPRLEIYQGDGAGGLTVLNSAPSGPQPDALDAADLDGDGDIDLVIANHDTDYLTLLLNHGRGSLAPAPASPLQVAVSPHPHVARAADLDGDGLIDLAVDHRDGEGLLILRGLGQGAFDAPGVLVEAGGDPYRGLAMGDLNGDGHLDLVTPNPAEVGILLNVGNGALAFQAEAPVAATEPFAVGLGDFNGDGRLDLISAAGEGSPLVEIFLGDGQGAFTPAADSPLRLATGGKNLVVGDFNGDGLADAAVASYRSPDVLVILGGPERFRTGTLPGGTHPWGLVAADLNGDGRDDLVIGDDAGPPAKVYLSVKSPVGPATSPGE